jgi:hypothetical protein
MVGAALEIGIKPNSSAGSFVVQQADAQLEDGQK